MISEKLIKGQLLIAEPSISGDLSFNRSVILWITMKKDQ
jgi:putative transcriptional regulator